MSNKNTPETEANTEEVVEETAPKVDNRSIRIQHDIYTGGEEVKRSEWIKEVFQDVENEAFYGNRGAIAKALTEMQGKEVPYQIVFAATKEIKGPADARKAAKAAAKEEATQAAAQAKADVEATE